MVKKRTVQRAVQEQHVDEALAALERFRQAGRMEDLGKVIFYLKRLKKWFQSG